MFCTNGDFSWCKDLHMAWKILIFICEHKNKEMSLQYRISKRGCNVKIWTHYIFLFIDITLIEVGIFHLLFLHKCLRLIMLITGVKLKG